MQTDPARELAVLTSSSYTDGSSRRGLARCAGGEKEKKNYTRIGRERGTKDGHQKSVKTRRTVPTGHAGSYIGCPKVLCNFRSKHSEYSCLGIKLSCLRVARYEHSRRYYYRPYYLSAIPESAFLFRVNLGNSVGFVLCDTTYSAHD